MGIIKCDFSGIDTLDIMIDAGFGMNKLMFGDEPDVYKKTIPIFMKKIVKKKLIEILYEFLKENESEIRLLNFTHDVGLYCGLANTIYKDKNVKLLVKNEFINAIYCYVEKKSSKFVDLDPSILAMIKDKDILASKIVFDEPKVYEYSVKSK